MQIHILDTIKFQPMKMQIHILTALRKLYPEQAIFDTDRIGMFDQAMGTDKVRLAIEAGVDAENIISSWQPDLAKFLELREKYLLYPQ